MPVWHTSAVDYNIDNRLFFTRHDAPGRPAVQLSVGAEWAWATRLRPA